MLKRLLGIVAVAILIAIPASVGNAAPNDPLFSKQWALTKIKAEQAWTISTGVGITIAIIDSGIELTHEDLAANLVAGTSVFKCPPRGKTCNSTGKDDHGHGTHVAGIAGAVKGNGKGIAGVAPGARLMPVKVLNSAGEGDIGDIVAGIRYAADHGAKVLNLSLGELSGAGNVYTQIGWNDPITQALDYAWSKGAVIVVAAGNDSFPLCAPPADHSKAICVGATDSNDLSSWYSNRGDVDVVAPGGEGSVFCEDWDLDILSTIWTGSSLDCQGPATNNPDFIFMTGYETLSGTSMAAPHVSGLAALLLARGLTNQQVVDRIKSTSDDLGTPGYDAVFGWGRINALRAVS